MVGESPSFPQPQVFEDLKRGFRDQQGGTGRPFRLMQADDRQCRPQVPRLADAAEPR